MGTGERWESTRKVLAWRVEKRVAAGVLPLAKPLRLGQGSVDAAAEEQPIIARGVA
jgi:hypothetical protein